MADTKISALTALTGANLATDDDFPVVDTSATATKRISKAELAIGLGNPLTLSSVGALTEITTLDADEMIYAVDDPSGTPASKKVRIGKLFAPTRQFFTNANTYLTNLMSQSGNTAIDYANVLHMGPIYVPIERAFTKLAINLQTLQGTSNIRIGLYNVNQETLQPTTLIEAAAVIDSSVATGATGLKEQTITQTLKPGFYALAFVTNGTPSINQGNTPQVPMGSVFSATMRPTWGLYRSFTYAALPADESAQTYSQGSVGSHTAFPLLGIR